MTSDEKIPVCCGEPLIMTFMFSGAEYYCRECKGTYGLLDVRSEFATPELIATRAANKEWFARVARNLIPRGAMKLGCDKCCNGSTHAEHASDQDLEASRQAYARLLGESS